MPNWLRKISQKASVSNALPETDSFANSNSESGSDPGEPGLSRTSRFNLESLEPRILLSGDPVLGELARLSGNDGAAEDNREAIVEEINLTELHGVSAADSSGSDEIVPSACLEARVNSTC